MPMRACLPRGAAPPWRWPADGGGGEVRPLLPLARIRLEPRQRPFPARGHARAAGARPRRAACASRATAGAGRTSWPSTAQRRDRRVRQQRSPICARLDYDLETLDLDRAARRRRRGHRPRVESARAGRRGLGAIARAGGPIVCCSTTPTTAPCRRRTTCDRLPLDGYDGILAFGEVVRRALPATGLGRRAWTWHEAADVRLFRPIEGAGRDGDLVWVGNWGDDERTVELDDLPARAGAPPPAHGPGLRRPLSRARPARAGGRRRVLRRLAAEPSRTGGLRPLRGDGARAAAALRPRAAGDPHHPRVRGAGLRHSAGVGAVERLSRACSGPRTCCSPRDGAEMSRHLRAVLADPELAQALAHKRARDHPGAPHLRPSRRSAPGDLRRARRAPARLPEVA